MTDDVEDLLGDPSQDDPHMALKALSSPRSRRQKESSGVGKVDVKMTGAMQGVTVYWLSQVFGLTPETVRKRLADCTPVSVHGKSNRYTVRDAAPYLVDPKIDIEKYLKRMNAGDLPPLLQKEIWDAKLKRQKWEAQAGDLWHTNDVMAVLSEVFSTIKSTVQLWPETVERTEGLTFEQRELLVKLGDNLQDELYQNIQAMAKRKNTKSSIVDLTVVDSEEDDDDDVEDLL